MSRRLLLIGACIVCLLVVSSALPAADPRLDAPGVGTGGESGGDDGGTWDRVVDTDPGDEPPDDSSVDDEAISDDDTEVDGGVDEPDLEIRGRVVPGNEVTVEVENVFEPEEEYGISVDGEFVARTDRGTTKVRVPFAEEMTVDVQGESVSTTVDVETAATIELSGGVAQNRNVTATVTVGGKSVPGVSVYQDGDRVGVTDDEGRVREVTMPERVGTVELRAERGPVAGERSVELPAPSVRVTSPFLFPGVPAPVEVTANGVGVPNATVEVEGGGSATTGDDGSVYVSLPIDSDATITAEVAGERATTTVGRLYLRLTVVTVLLPGVLLGFAWSYFKLAARYEREPHEVAAGGGLGIAAVFLALGDALGDLVDALGELSVPQFSWSSLGFPRLGLLSAVSVPSLSWPSFSWPSFTWPSFGSSGVGSVLSGLRSSGEAGSGRLSSIRERLSIGGSDDDGDEDADAAPGPSLADEPFGPPSPRAELRAYWHAFLDRVGLRNRETRTPGQAARRALSAGFPARKVRRLLGAFRQVEYGDGEPSPERLSEALQAADDLLDHDSEEEGSE